MHKQVLICLFSLLSSAGVIFVLRYFALRSGVLASKGIASIGGIGIGITLVIFSLGGISLMPVVPGKIVEIVMISLMMLVFGVMDDLREASVVKKFVFQSICAILLILIGVRTHIVYLNDWGNALVTYLWVVGITNAFNLLDVMDGLCAGAALTVTASLFVFSLTGSDGGLQLLTLGLFGAIQGFLLFNFPPARVYLGNAGSHFLGFILAALALMVSYSRDQHAATLVSPIIIFWLPLLETFGLIYFRFRKRLIPFNKSNDHMALRLVALGLTNQKSLFVLLGLSTFFVFCGTAISLTQGLFTGVLLGSVAIVSAILFSVLMKVKCNEG